MTAAASSPEDNGTPTNCTCDRWCYDKEDGSGHPLCEHCRHLDPYDPCPVTGFGCGLGGDPNRQSCDCCTPDEWKAAAS